jgi:hypothetical protein
MRLRLRLAAFKVQSNQMDIPISQLRIKTLPMSPKLPKLPKLPSLPRPSATANTSQRRTPLPSAIPEISLQKPSGEGPRSLIPSSPPPPYRSTDSTASPRKELFATPLLPRQAQGQGLLNPPTLGSPTWKDRDLTSSAVKGKAADSLLSLMRQHC